MVSKKVAAGLLCGIMITGLAACGAKASDEAFEIITEPDDFSAVRDDLEAKGYIFASAEVEQVPDTYVTLTDEDAIKNMTRLLDMLDENDDVQNVWHNWEE